MISSLTNHEILLKLFNNPGALETVLKFDSVDLINFNNFLDWSPSLVSNIIKHNFVMFDVLIKLKQDDRECLREFFTWSNTLHTHIKQSQNFFTLLNKISEEDRRNLKQIAMWSSDLIAQMSKDSQLIELLTKLSKSDVDSLSAMFSWSDSLISILNRNRDVVKFVNTLSEDEVESYKTVLLWPRNLLKTFVQQPDHLAVLYKVWDKVKDKDQFVETYLRVYATSAEQNYDIIDAFSKGQLNSKKWLIEQLELLDYELGNVWVLCGWIGSLPYLMSNGYSQLKYASVRSFDIDKNCAPLAELLNKKDVINSWRFKSSTLDVNSMRYTNYKFATAKSDGTIQYIHESADTIINTSCDHMMSNTWWERIPSGALVVLQNNDFIQIGEHVNTVSSLDEFKQKYPMTDLLYQGELDCDVYTRYMLIGRK